MMDWGQAATLVFTTGVVTTLITLGYSEFRDWRNRRGQARRHANYLALQTAVSLEAYVEACTDTVQDIALYLDDDEAVTDIPSIPPAPSFPSDNEGWRDLRVDLAARALAFPNQVVSAQGLVRTMAMEEAHRERKAYRTVVLPDNLPGETSIPDLVEREALKLARDAWKLAEELRTAYKLPAYKSAYDALEWIEWTLEQAEELEAKRQQARELFVGMFEGEHVSFISPEGSPEDGPEGELELASGKPAGKDIDAPPQASAPEATR